MANTLSNGDDQKKSLLHSKTAPSTLWSLAGSYLTTTCRTLVLGKLKGLHTGSLTIVEPGVGVYTFGTKKSAPSVEIRVLDSTFWPRLLLHGPMGFAEAFMDGIITCKSVTDVLELLIINRDETSDYNTLSSWALSIASGFYRATNSLSVSRSNVALHYDLSNEIFAAFLSDDMTYSCPIYASATDSLEAAQIRKLDRIIEQARITATDHVLEIGTGWGSFAIEAVRRTGCKVTSITLSKEQKEEAEVRIKAAGFNDKIEVFLRDYREVKGTYDRVVSIEMIEHVGRENLEAYFACVSKLLAKKRGVAVFQTSTMPETRYEAYCRGTDFIRKHIFPGANVPSIAQIIASMHKGSAGNLILDKLENIGGHYVKALKTWRETFFSNFSARIRPELLKNNSGMSELDIEVFKRKWEYYFSICEAGFKTKTLGCVMFTLGREGNSEMIQDILVECGQIP
ncbi:Tuberculostearic acid methyltransferase UfaA1 [Lachnellula suecica]|uniref:Tuberculostearic acid methyltransferase UfaA1 n=1 Tax=Lachnellula suecica TaxID=602035 RepID=A0A8T9CBZ5_9HELO|nr:Tuberculostearic acid methyltransferase UfaA1 [Lachnellula suecica]